MAGENTDLDVPGSF